jgi:hypothetical protein
VAVTAVTAIPAATTVMAADGDATHGGQPDRVAGDHDPLAVVPVGNAAREQREQQVAEHGREAGDARLGRRAGHRQDQQRIGDLGGPRAEQGDRLATPEQLEVPVAARRDDHGYPLPPSRSPAEALMASQYVRNKCDKQVPRKSP